MEKCKVVPEYEVKPSLNTYLDFNISFTIVMLLWELFLLTRMYYGSIEISRCVFMPFKWASAALMIFGTTMIFLRLYS